MVEDLSADAEGNNHFGKNGRQSKRRESMPNAGANIFELATRFRTNAIAALRAGRKLFERIRS